MQYHANYSVQLVKKNEKCNLSKRLARDKFKSPNVVDDDNKNNDVSNSISDPPGEKKNPNK